MLTAGAARRACASSCMPTNSEPGWKARYSCATLTSARSPWNSRLSNTGVARFERLLRRPQAEDVFDLLQLYGERCLPVPRRTERYYWSVSCLPSTSDKPLVRVNASWMELFTLLPDDDELRSRFILHLSDFTLDGSPEPDHLDHAFLEQCIDRPEDVSHAFWRTNGIIIVKIRGAASIRQFMTNPRALRAIRNFNLTHMNRGRNAYQASHCYSVADRMLGD